MSVSVIPHPQSPTQSCPLELPEGVRSDQHAKEGSDGWAQQISSKWTLSVSNIMLFIPKTSAI